MLSFSLVFLAIKSCTGIDNKIIEVRIMTLISSLKWHWRSAENAMN